jgi:hypothetical protein
MMTIPQVEALVRNLVLHRRLPLTFQSVSVATNGWHIDVRHDTGATLSITVPGGRPLDVRSAIQEQLETALEDAAAVH